jgi:hypothetical protein
MRAVYEALKKEGKEFTSEKAAYRAVLDRCGIKGKPRGWSSRTFHRARTSNS